MAATNLLHPHSPLCPLPNHPRSDLEAHPIESDHRQIALSGFFLSENFLDFFLGRLSHLVIHGFDFGGQMRNTSAGANTGSNASRPAG